MEKKKIYIAIAIVLVIIGGFFAYTKHQEHQQQIAKQQEEKEFKDFCTKNILGNLNKCITLHRDISNILRTAQGRNFENLFKELNIQKDKVATLKQDMAEISAKTDKQKEIRHYLKECLNAVDVQATCVVVYFEKQRSAQGAEGWNQEEYDRYISERDEALQKAREVEKTYVESKDKVTEMAHFQIEKDYKAQSQEEKQQ